MSKLIVISGITVLSLSWWLETNEIQAPIASHFEKIDKNVESIKPSSIHQKGRKFPPINEFQDIVERPIFTPNRRPMSSKQEIAELDLEPEPNFNARFIGSIISHHARRAFFSSAWGVHSAAVGDNVDGWTVVEISQRRTILVLDEKIIELRIFDRMPLDAEHFVRSPITTGS